MAEKQIKKKSLAKHIKEGLAILLESIMLMSIWLVFLGIVIVIVNYILIKTGGA